MNDYDLIELKEEEIKKYLKTFYTQFDNGYQFEDFLKLFLEKLGFKEVVVTQKSRDKGVDLLCKSPTLLDTGDFVEYKVQAKRYDPDKTSNPKDIDALRGNLKENQKGIFITTAKVSDAAKEDALCKDKSRPINVIDGKRIIELLIDHNIGFIYKPFFSIEKIQQFIPKNENFLNDQNQTIISSSPSNTIEWVKKELTKNDVRARIMRVPSYIVNCLNDHLTKHKLKLFVENSKKEYEVTFCPSGNYISSIKSFFEDYKIIDSEQYIKNIMISWSTDKINLFIRIENSL